jgi:hypothetical protein
MSRLPHFLDNQLTNGGKVVFAARKNSGTNLCWRLSEPQDHSEAGEFGKLEKKFNDLIANGIVDLPACRQY